MHCHIGHWLSTPHCLHLPKPGRESGCAKTLGSTGPYLTLSKVVFEMVNPIFGILKYELEKAIVPFLNHQSSFCVNYH